MTGEVLDALVRAEEAGVRYKVRVNALGEEPGARAIKRLRVEVRESERVRALLSECDAEGRIPRDPYSKWRGAHWVLAALADLGYPPGDASLIPLREQVLKWLVPRRRERRITPIKGLFRRHASQEGNAVHALLSLGLADERVDQLVKWLIEWQWPDGGWNCDKRPEAHNSSYHESWIPLRALSLYGKMTGDRDASAAAQRAAELFLKRRLYRRQSDGSVISPMWTRLRYPPYWHYGILYGLKAMAEAGAINDERCRDALDLLESKRLPDGGFPAEGRSYHTPDEPPTPGRRATGRSLVEWGIADGRSMNEFVTVEALAVLRAAGR
jgi:hypothetical protein